MREKSEMKAAMSAQMGRLEPPSRTVESEPENVINKASPGRSSSWILPSETPDRPTTSGLQTPMVAPVELGPNPVIQQHSCQSDLTIPPALWRNHLAREEGAEECELFGEPPYVKGDPFHDLLYLKYQSWREILIDYNPWALKDDYRPTNMILESISFSPKCGSLKAET